MTWCSALFSVFASLRSAGCLILLLVSGVCFSSPAAAQNTVRRSFLVPDGYFELTGEPARPQILHIDVSRDNPGPTSLAPHFYWGASDHVTLGITHRRGFCLSECGERRYNDVGFAILAGLTRSHTFELDLHVGLQARSFDPNFAIGIQTGVIGRLSFGSTAFVFDPSLYVGISQRDAGNREQVVLPFWFYFQASDVVVPFVGAAVVGPLDGFGDAVSVPVEGGMLFEVGRNVDLGFNFRFYNLLGNGGNARGRELGMLARFRF